MFIKTRARSTGSRSESEFVATANAVVPSPIKAKKRSKAKITGRWEKHERMAFLRGYRKFGRGKWKQIGSLIPSRTTVQVKTHAQVIIKRIETGEDVFEELDRYYREDARDDMSSSSSFASDDSESRDDFMDEESLSDDSSTVSTTDPCLSWMMESQDVDAAKVLAIMRCGDMSPNMCETNTFMMHDAEPIPFRSNQPLHFACV